MAKLVHEAQAVSSCISSLPAYTRCRICGCPTPCCAAFMCAVCAFRELAYKGEIPGVKKASW